MSCSDNKMVGRSHSVFKRNNSALKMWTLKFLSLEINFENSSRIISIDCKQRNRQVPFTHCCNNISASLKLWIHIFNRDASFSQHVQRQRFSLVEMGMHSATFCQFRV